MTRPDRSGCRFFVYSLSGADGEVLYVGRSSNVANRLIAHHSQASNPDTMEAPRKALWLMDVRNVHVVGPFTWEQAISEERRLVELLQPYGNERMTKRDPNRRIGGKRRALRSVA